MGPTVLPRLFFLVAVLFATSPLAARAEDPPDPDAAVRKCVEELRSPDAIVRLRAAKGLGAMGPAAGAAIPALKALADDPDEDVRMVAANALEKIQAGPDPKVAELSGQLADPDPLVRMRAAKLLGALGPAARTALPALRALAADPDEDVRLVAAAAVRRIAPGGDGPPEPPRDAPPPARPGVSADHVRIVESVSLFCEAYKDATGMFTTPASRFFLVRLHSDATVPVLVTTLSVGQRDGDDDVGREAVEGPRTVLLPDQEIWHEFSLPIRKASIRCELAVTGVAPADLRPEDLAKERRNAELLARLRVMEPRTIVSFGVPVGLGFTIQNPDDKPARGVRVALFGTTVAGQLTTLQFYWSEEVPPGFSQFVDNPTNGDEPRKGSFVFDGYADAKRDVFPDRYRGVVVGVGVPKRAE